MKKWRQHSGMSILLLTGKCLCGKENYCNRINGSIPPVDSSCWNWNPVDLTVQKGCDSLACENAVCDCDSYCCNTSWDLSCRGYSTNETFSKDNHLNPGCSASILCCEEDLIVKEEFEEKGFCKNLDSLVPPKDSSCWDYNLIDSPNLMDQKGCDSLACQSAVCSCDPYCCSTSWDESCRGHSVDGILPKDNLMIPGCSASILCCEEILTFMENIQEENLTDFVSITKESYSFKEYQDQTYCNKLKALSPPSDSNCWNADSTRKGCDYEACQNAVCSCDPYCCTTYWDESCRGSLLDKGIIPGCSASILCCEEDVTLTEQHFTNYAGPCPSDPSIIGYKNIETLLFDMEKQDSSNLFIICPSTTFDLGTGTEYSVKPKSNIILICGNGYTSNKCFILNGLHHLIFPSNETITNVIIQGITFSNSASTSIVGWSSSPSNALFRDCEWKHNHGFSVIDIYGGNEAQRRFLRPKERSLNSQFDNYGMLIQFENCGFIENVAKVGILLITKAKAQLTNCLFLFNAVGGIIVGVANQAVLLLDRTSFSNNTSAFSTFFLDSTSTLELQNSDHKAQTFGNRAANCTGFFIEETGSQCLNQGGYNPSCFGRCV